MRLFLKLILSGILVIILLAIVSYSEYQRFISKELTIPESGYTYTVTSGSNLQAISRDIHNAGLSDFPPEYLSFYGRFKNKAHLIKAGEYLIPINTTSPQLLDILIKGDVIQYSITIIEGTSSQQLIDMLVADNRLKHELKSSQLSDVMKELGQDKSHGEGEFLPETYFFTAGTSDKALLQRAAKMMTSTLIKEWKNRDQDLPYKTSYEALIMASIIEKETGIAEERGQISGVFFRRLQIGMKLQTDPTVVYGMGASYKGNIRRKDLTTDTIYNTYTRFGLPPSPIALPSKESIYAALHPVAGKSLYFVATGSEGRHAFSNNLAAHNKAVRKYQLKK